MFTGFVFLVVFLFTLDVVENKDIKVLGRYPYYVGYFESEAVPLVWGVGKVYDRECYFMKDLRLCKSPEKEKSNQNNDLSNALYLHFLKWRPELLERYIPHIQNNTTDGLVYEQL